MKPDQEKTENSAPVSSTPLLAALMDKQHELEERLTVAEDDLKYSELRLLEATGQMKSCIHHVEYLKNQISGVHQCINANK